jgi:putative endonuclease
VLYSPSTGRTYTGYTSDLPKRFGSHNNLATKGFTIKFRPWVILLTEFYALKSDALKREKELKGGQGRAFIRQLIKQYSN